MSTGSLEKSKNFTPLVLYRDLRVLILVWGESMGVIGCGFGCGFG
jgi:hypothetical protein